MFAADLNRPVRHRVLSVRPEPAVRLRRQHRLGGPLPVSERRPQGARAEGNHRNRRLPGRRPLDARHRLLARRQEDVRRRRLAIERGRSGHHAGGEGSRHGPRVQRRRIGTPRLRQRHPQRRRARGAPDHRADLGGGQRARQSRRQPGPRLHLAHRGGRLLRVALLLPRRQPRSAARRQAPGAEGQGQGAGRAPAAAQRAARHGVLRRPAVRRRTSRQRSSPPRTARGTAAPAPATRSFACRSTTAQPPASIRTS